MNRPLPVYGSGPLGPGRSGPLLPAYIDAYGNVRQWSQDRAAFATVHGGLPGFGALGAVSETYAAGTQFMVSVTVEQPRFDVTGLRARLAGALEVLSLRVNPRGAVIPDATNPHWFLYEVKVKTLRQQSMTSVRQAVRSALDYPSGNAKSSGISTLYGARPVDVTPDPPPSGSPPSGSPPSSPPLVAQPGPGPATSTSSRWPWVVGGVLVVGGAGLLLWTFAK